MKNKNRSKVYSLLIVKRVMFIQRSDVFAKKIYVNYNEAIRLLKATYIRYNGRNYLLRRLTFKQELKMLC